MKPGEMRGLGQAHERVTVERWREGESSVAVDDVAEECPVALVYNGVPFAVMLATPLDLEDFARGFTWTEGIVEHPDECQGIEIEPEQQGYSIYVSVPKARTASLSERRRSLAGRTGCGLCGTQMLDDAIRPVRQVTPLAPGLDHAAIQRARQSLATGQTLNALTGAVHAAGWADTDGRLQLLREDVGRHNALDKLIGAGFAAGLDLAHGMAIVTSRASHEMVHKTAAAGIPVLCAVSAPTALAVRTAVAAGLTLVGFTREDRHTVYAPSRPTP